MIPFEAGDPCQQLQIGTGRSGCVEAHQVVCYLRGVAPNVVRREVLLGQEVPPNLLLRIAILHTAILVLARIGLGLKEPAMETLDLRKKYKGLYQPSAKEIELLTVPPLQFAMIDGSIEKGEEPGTSPGLAEAMQALYSVAYTLRFMFKKRKEEPVKYPVMPLEGLWWVEDGNFDFTVKDNWYFTLMIMHPDAVTHSAFAEGLEEVRHKRGDSTALHLLRLDRFEEGLCVQTMHVGPYATEPATLERIQAFMRENGLRDRVGLGGKHHEIYLGDPRRAAPEKLKTVLRHPVANTTISASSSTG